MDEKQFVEFRDRLMLDDDFIEFIRAGFMKAFDGAVSLSVHVETKQKRCPICHSGMILRASKKDGGFFWGCAAYPRCKGLSQASAAEVEEFKKACPEQFAVLWEQHEVYERAHKESGAEGYDNEIMREKKPHRRRAKEENKEYKDGRDKDAVIEEILNDSKVK